MANRSSFGLFITLLLNLVLGMLATSLPLYMLSRGVSVIEMGLIFAVYPLVFPLLRTIIGALSDRMGSSVFLFASGLLHVAAAAVYGFAASPLIFAAGKGLEGLAGSTGRGIERSMIFEKLEMASMGRVAGFYSAAIWTGNALGAFLAGYLLSVGFWTVFAVMAVAGAAFTLASFLMRDEKKVSKKQLDAAFDYAVDFKGMDGRIWKMTRLLFVDGVGYTIVSSFVIVLILNKVYSAAPDLIGLFLLGLYLATGASSVAAGHLADRLNPRALHFSGSVLVVATLLASSLALSIGLPLAFFFVLQVLQFVGHGMRSPTFMKILAAYAHPDRIGKEMNFPNIGWWGGIAVGNAAAGLLIATVGFSNIYLLAAALELAYGVLLVRVR